MKYLFLLCSFTFLLIASPAKADQLQWLTKKQVKKAKRFLKKNRSVTLFCGCCSEEMPIDIKIETIDVTQVSDGEDGDFYEISISYQIPVSENYDTVDSGKVPIDLAYVWITKKGKLATIGTHLKFEHDPCSSPGKEKE